MSPASSRVDCSTDPSQYRHRKLSFAGPQKVQGRFLQFAATRDRPRHRPDLKLALPELTRTIDADALRCPHVTVEIDRIRRTASWTVRAPSACMLPPSGSIRPFAAPPDRLPAARGAGVAGAAARRGRP